MSPILSRPSAFCRVDREGRRLELCSPPLPPGNGSAFSICGARRQRSRPGRAGQGTVSLRIRSTRNSCRRSVKTASADCGTSGNRWIRSSPFPRPTQERSLCRRSPTRPLDRSPRRRGVPTDLGLLRHSRRRAAQSGCGASSMGRVLAFCTRTPGPGQTIAPSTRKTRMKRSGCQSCSTTDRVSLV